MLFSWLIAAAAFAGKRALRRAATGLVALPPGGVVVESAPAWDHAPAAEAGSEAGTALMGQAQQVAYRCFEDRFALDLLDGRPLGWSVTVDAGIGAGGGMGFALVDGIALDGELECLEDGLAELQGPLVGAPAKEAGPFGITLRISAPSPQPMVGDANVTLEKWVPSGDNPVRRRALRLETRAEELALMCAREVGAPGTGSWYADGAVLHGAPEAFSACWAANAETLEAFTDGAAPLRLRFVAAPAGDPSWR